MLKDYSTHPFTVQVSLIIIAESGINHKRSCARCHHNTFAKNVLCNYYMYPLKVFNTQFISAEHAHQLCFMMYIGRDDHAHDILGARTPAEAKEIASRIPGYLHKDWLKIKLTVMRHISCKGRLLPTFQICLN